MPNSDFSEKSAVESGLLLLTGTLLVFELVILHFAKPLYQNVRIDRMIIFTLWERSENTL